MGQPVSRLWEPGPGRATPAWPGRAWWGCSVDGARGSSWGYIVGVRARVCIRDGGGYLRRGVSVYLFAIIHYLHRAFWRPDLLLPYGRPVTWRPASVLAATARQ